jgi:hypothetical protein
MDDIQLKRSIQSIGMACFVKYFEAFENKKSKSEDLIDGLMKIENYDESGAKTRVSQSRRIIREDRVLDALNIIIDSKKVEEWAKSKAQFLRSKIT